VHYSKSKVMMVTLAVTVPAILATSAHALSSDEAKCVEQAGDLNGPPRLAFLNKCLSKSLASSQASARMRERGADMIPGNWHYSQDTDKMDSSLTQLANIISENSLALGFPYAGENRGHLGVRKEKKSGLNVWFNIDKGQLICNSYDGCQIDVRFDDAPPIKFHGVGPADHSSNTVFLQPEGKFVELAKKAKQIRVAATIYQAGTQILEFSTEPLVWGMPTKK
jgi:hypothetical protein